MSTPDLSVVVPVFNNATTLPSLLDRQIRVLEGLGTSFEMIFVDDGSRDGSLAVLQARAADDPRIRVFPLVRNFGGQAAVCAGFDQVRGRRTVLMDADLENLPEDIPKLLAALDDEHDLVCGVRVDRRDSWLWRRLPSKLMNAYVRRQTETRVRDIGCAFRAMDSRIVQNLGAEGEHRRMLSPLLLRRARSVVEVPVRHEPKEARGGHSFLSLLGIAMDYYLLTAKRPFLVTGVLSGLTLLVGLATVVFSLGAQLMPGLVLGVGGGLGAIASMVGEYVQRSYQIGQGLQYYKLQEPDKTDDARSEPSLRN